MAGNNITEVLPPEIRNSFTALLGLPANQAVELLYEPEYNKNPVIPAMKISEEMQNVKLKQSYSSNCSSMFITNSDLVEREPRYSIMPETNFVISSNSSELKKESMDSDSNTSSSPIFSDSSTPNEIKRSSTKRKEREKKVKVSGGNSKNVEEDRQKLPYVHVRARRGQATDNHSLAERARREKINAKMKLLQDLVPGCAKITGTALVLDEIINHVQSLQHQVEFLSMKLATVNPRLGFNQENLLSFQQSGGTLSAKSFQSTITADPSLWPDLFQTMISNNSTTTATTTTTGVVTIEQQHYHQWHPDIFQQQPVVWERDSNQRFVTSPDNSLYSSYNSTNSVVIRPDHQLKMEI